MKKAIQYIGKIQQVVYRKPIIKKNLVIPCTEIDYEKRGFYGC